MVNRRVNTEDLLAEIKRQGLCDEYERRVQARIDRGEIAPTAHNYVRRQFAKQFKFDGNLPAPRIPTWCDLRMRHFKDKKKVSLQEAIEWACDNILYKDVQYFDAPSAQAWLYLTEMRRDTLFRKDIMKKRIPSLSKVEQLKGMRDDGRKQIQLIEKLQSEAEESSPNTVLPLGKKNLKIG